MRTSKHWDSLTMRCIRIDIHTYMYMYIYTCMWGNTCHANESLDESLGNYRQFKKCTYIIMARKNESFVRIWRKSCIISLSNVHIYVLHVY